MCAVSTTEEPCCLIGVDLSPSLPRSSWPGVPGGERGAQIFCRAQMSTFATKVGEEGGRARVVAVVVATAAAFHAVGSVAAAVVCSTTSFEVAGV